MDAVHSDTTTQPANIGVSVDKSSWLTRLEERSEFSRYAIMSVGLLLIGIVGGVVVGFFAKDVAWQMAVIIGFTMLSLSMMLAVAPMKWVIRSLAAALAVDLLIVLMHLI